MAKQKASECSVFLCFFKVLHEVGVTKKKVKMHFFLKLKISHCFLSEIILLQQQYV